MPISPQPLKILFEDPFYVGFFKPAGIPTTYGAEQGCFVEQVKARFPELFTFIGFKPEEGGLLYRLDNDACGLLLFAKNEEAFHRFNNDETLEKIYIVEIEPISKNFSLGSKKFDELPKTGLLTFPLVHKSSKKMAALLPDKKIHYHGKPLPAETHYEKLNKRLVRCNIKKASATKSACTWPQQARPWSETRSTEGNQPKHCTCAVQAFFQKKPSSLPYRST